MAAGQRLGDELRSLPSTNALHRGARGVIVPRSRVSHLLVPSPEAETSFLMRFARYRSFPTEFFFFIHCSRGSCRDFAQGTPASHLCTCNLRRTTGLSPYGNRSHSGRWCSLDKRELLVNHLRLDKIAVTTAHPPRTASARPCQGLLGSLRLSWAMSVLVRPCWALLSSVEPRQAQSGFVEPCQALSGSASS